MMPSILKRILKFFLCTESGNELAPELKHNLDMLKDSLRNSQGFGDLDPLQFQGKTSAINK